MQNRDSGSHTTAFRGGGVEKGAGNYIFPLLRLADDSGFGADMTSDSPDTMRKLRELDPDVWKVVYHNPVALLQRVPDEEIARRVNDLEMQTRIDQAYRRLKQYLGGGESWGTTHAGPLLAHPVAYFSAEFGIHQSLPIYSGGLGVLAGDHLKSTSDLGV